MPLVNSYALLGSSPDTQLLEVLFQLRGAMVLDPGESQPFRRLHILPNIVHINAVLGSRFAGLQRSLVNGRIRLGHPYGAGINPPLGRKVLEEVLRGLQISDVDRIRVG
jgi:hypothetical protein